MSKEYDVKFEHFRVPKFGNHPQKGLPPMNVLSRYYRGDNSWLPYERGGQTVCTLSDKDGYVLARGISTCSMSDNFDYGIGRKIAFGRAMAKLEELENDAF